MTVSREKNFSRILKASSLLGFASLINVFLGAIRVKVLAVQLGPALFGTMSLYTNFITTIGSITSLGIGQSAVRDIATVAEPLDGQAIARKVAILHRVVWVTGAFGFIITLGLAIPGSFWIFGSYDHVQSIALLAVIVLITQIQAGQTAILSGLRRISDLAKINVIGGILSTTLAIALLLLLGAKGIVPFLIAVAVGQLTVSWWFARKIKIGNIHVSWRECFVESREMVRLGLTMVASSTASTISTLVILMVIRRYEGESAVGLYQSALTISSIYVGFILQGMSGDYFPRLVGVSDNRILRNQAVNEQAEMAMLLAVPGLVAALVVSDILLPLLYSSRFDGASEILRWQVLGMLGRIISWPQGFILFARSDKTAVLTIELLTATIHSLLVWLGVQYFGAVGAGMAFTAQYTLHIGLIGWAVKVRHGFKMSESNRNILFVGSTFVVEAFGVSIFSSAVWRYSSGILILLLSICWSLHGLVQRLGRDQVINAIQRIFEKLRLTFFQRKLMRFAGKA